MKTMPLQTVQAGQFNVTAPLDDYLLLIKAELQSEAR
jgi:hypothetical protein